jgi:hypothetical protein
VDIYQTVKDLPDFYLGLVLQEPMLPVESRCPTTFKNINEVT